MIFTHLIIENFFLVSKPIEIPMKDQGLVCISGNNGAGKSTIFEALVWTLYGRTFRGLSGDDVVNRNVRKNCRVVVGLEHEGGQYLVIRYRKHSSGRNGLEFHGPSGDLTQGTAKLTQKKIDAFLGIDFDTFVNGPMMPQSNFRKFSLMTDAEQKAIFDQALRTDVLGHAQSEVKDRISKASQKLLVARNDLESIQREVEDYKSRISHYEDLRSGWTDTKKKRLAKIANELTALVMEQENIWESVRVDQSEMEVATAKNDVRKASNSKAEIETKWGEVQKSLNKDISLVRATISSKVREKDKISNRISQLSSMNGSTCQTCGQDIGPEHVERCTENLKEEMLFLSEEIESLKEKLSDLSDQFEQEDTKYSKKIVDLDALISLRNDKYLSLLEKLSEGKSKVKEAASLEHQEELLRSSYIDKRDEPFPYEDEINRLTSLLPGLHKSRVMAKSVVYANEIEIDHLTFWLHGFSNKGLKSYILDSVTPFLNARADLYTQALTNGDIKVEFCTQTKLKNGETREKFSVSVTNKNGAETYSGNSGGEKGRADLSINFSLSDLIASRSKQSYPQRFLDEPFEGLDEEGVESVMELLQDMAEKSGSIFVITHNDAMKGLFPRSIHVVKKNGSTRVLK